MSRPLNVLRKERRRGLKSDRWRFCVASAKRARRVVADSRMLNGSLPSASSSHAKPSRGSPIVIRDTVGKTLAAGAARAFASENQGSRPSASRGIQDIGVHDRIRVAFLVEERLMVPSEANVEGGCGFSLMSS